MAMELPHTQRQPKHTSTQTGTLYIIKVSSKDNWIAIFGFGLVCSKLVGVNLDPVHIHVCD